MMGKKSQKQGKPLRREAKNGVQPYEFGTDMIPPPVLETKEDCLIYLQRDLPEWIDAIGVLFSPPHVQSTAATLFWDLRQTVCAIGHALDTGLAPIITDEIADKHRRALMDWAITAFEKGDDLTDGLLFLEAAKRGLEAEGDAAANVTGEPPEGHDPPPAPA